MTKQLKGKKIAILVAAGFEQGELTVPQKALETARFQTEIVAPAGPTVKGRHFTQWGDELPVDVPLEQANPDHYIGLLLPGGLLSLDNLRTNPQAVHFVKALFEAGRPIAAIGHGPWLLIEAEVVQGRRLTADESIQTDLENAGAQWVKQEVVVDGGLITCGQPGDVLAFSQKLVEEFANIGG
jgi:protease I